MNKTTKITHTLIVAIIIFCIISLTAAIFNLSFAIFILSTVPYLIAVGSLSLILSVIIRKNRIVGAALILFFVAFFSFILFVINTLENEDAEKVIWNSANDSFTTDFIVGNQGHIYLNAKINDISGLFLFDTGCELSNANEKFVADNKMKLRPYTILDAKAIKQTKSVYKVKSFELGAIGIQNLHVYPTDSISWTNPRGFHYKQESVLGIIGNNIISNFIWDFDLINRRVTVSNKKTYCNNLPDSLAIDLVSKNNQKEIAVEINGVSKMLILDFGCSFPIIISDSIPNRKIAEKKGFFSQNMSSLLSHLESTGGENSNFDFVNIKLDSHEFEQIKCFENEHADLLGIPFVWAFERVVLDFNNNKSYFIAKNYSASDFGVNKYNRQSVMNATGITTMICKPEGMPLIIEKDSIRIRYVIYGSLKLYKNNNSLDSISCSDSLLLPNGRIRYGPFTINFKK